MDSILFFIRVSGGPRVLCFLSGTHLTHPTNIYIKKKPNPNPNPNLISLKSLSLSLSYGAYLILRLPLSLTVPFSHPQAGPPHELTFKLPHVHTKPPHSLTLTLRPPHLRVSIWSLTLRSAAVKLHNHTARSPSSRSNLPRLTSPESP